jgi:Na+-driven multidrug efflux pump
MLIMLAGCSIIFFFGAHLTRFFINDPAVIEVGIRMFRVTSIASLLFGVVFIFMGVFNGSGHTRPTMMLNISRLWLLRIPFVYLLSGKLLQLLNLDGGVLHDVLSAIARPLAASPFDALWWSMVISNSVIGFFAFMIYRRGHWKTPQIHQ